MWAFSPGTDQLLPRAEHRGGSLAAEQAPPAPRELVAPAAGAGPREGRTGTRGPFWAPGAGTWRGGGGVGLQARRGRGKPGGTPLAGPAHAQSPGKGRGARRGARGRRVEAPGAQGSQGDAHGWVSAAAKLCFHGTAQVAREQVRDFPAELGNLRLAGFVQAQPAGAQSAGRGRRDTVQPPGSGRQTWKVRVAGPRSWAQQAFESGR